MASTLLAHLQARHAGREETNEEHAPEPPEYVHSPSAGHTVRTEGSGRMSNQFASMLVAAGIWKGPSKEQVGEEKPTPPRDGNRRNKNGLSLHCLGHGDELD